MIAILGGLGAAACWACATMCATHSSRLIGANSLVAGVMLVGLAVTAPLAAIDGIPERMGARELGWMAVSGIGNIVGLLLAYSALKIGKVAIVTGLTSTEGAIAALLAVATGETLAARSAAMLVVIAAGVVLVSAARGERSGHPVRATLLAGTAAFSFGASLYATGRVSHVLPIIWALIPARVVGVVAVSLPLIVSRRLVVTRRAAPLVAGAGLCEVLGFASYSIGSRHGIAVSAVLASQFAALAAVAAFFVFHERLTRLQIAGVASIAVGVAVLSATS